MLPKLSGTILFIDDIPLNVELGIIFLKRLGCEPVGLTSPTEALAVFKEDPDRFDLAITDLFMPEINGFDLAEEFLALRPDLPIIIITGDDNAATDQATEGLKIHAYLLKPLTIDRLAETLAQVLPGAG